MILDKTFTSSLLDSRCRALTLDQWRRVPKLSDLSLSAGITAVWCDIFSVVVCLVSPTLYWCRRRSLHCHIICDGVESGKQRLLLSSAM